MRKSIVYTLIACLLVSSLPFSVTADANDDIPTNAAGTGIHDSLVAALTQADLVTTLQGTGPFTVFAPTDQAFADAGIDLTTFDTDEENATLVDILTYHVVSGKVMSTDLTDGMEAAALNQDTLTFSVSSSEVKVNDAVVTLADVESSNGVIHVIDKVLMPPADPVYVDIPATAQSTGIHTALVAALSQANLVTALQSEGPFTVFAPTDQAFTDAGIDLTTFDTDEEIATLVDILTYHVYSGAVPSSAVTDGLAVTMFNGDKASFAVGTDGTVTIGDATVTGADVQTSNGIIHVIDKVLMPPAGDICYTMVSHTIVPGATNLICNSYMYVEDYTVGGQTITGCYNTVT
ncbi:MAG: fasciclin domain-containing protein, partial [Euryarchaeota archaeon]|nr:fasciclin domain-containing protein [Euryarchaeota archaeon]